MFKRPQVPQTIHINEDLIQPMLHDPAMTGDMMGDGNTALMDGEEHMRNAIAGGLGHNHPEMGTEPNPMCERHEEQAESDS